MAESAAGTTPTLKMMTLTTLSNNGVAQTQYMLDNDLTKGFSITFELSGNTLKYVQTTDLHVYEKDFSHIDSDTLKKIPTR